MSQVTFTNPIWGNISGMGVPNTVTLPASTSIAYDGNDSDITAFKFCEAYDYSLISYVVGAEKNPSVSWHVNNNRWQNDGTEPAFLQISCDNGLNESLGEVNIANIGDIMLLLGIVIALLTVQVSLLVFGRN